VKANGAAIPALDVMDVERGWVFHAVCAHTRARHEVRSGQGRRKFPDRRKTRGRRAKRHSPLWREQRFQRVDVVRADCGVGRPVQFVEVRSWDGYKLQFVPSTSDERIAEQCDITMQLGTNFFPSTRPSISRRP
jgi:hypothetical protein